MKVQCVRIDNPLRALSIPTIGQDYVVLEVVCPASGNALVRIEVDDVDRPSLWPADMFVVINGRLPSGWKAASDTDGTLLIGPAEWLSRKFWDDYFDGDPAAAEKYRAGRSTSLEAG